MHRQHLAASRPSAVVSSYVFWEVHVGSSLDKQHLAASRPSTVVSTSMARSSAPFGFSAKSTMRPASSICSSSTSRVRLWRFHHVRAHAGEHDAARVGRCMPVGNSAAPLPCTGAASSCTTAAET